MSNNAIMAVPVEFQASVKSLDAVIEPGVDGPTVTRPSVFTSARRSGKDGPV